MTEKFYLHRFSHCRAIKEKGLKVLWNSLCKEKDKHELLGDSKSQMMKEPIIIIRKNHNNELWFDVMIESTAWNPESVKSLDDKIMSEIDSKFENGWVSIVDINARVHIINEKMEEIIYERC